MSITIETNIPLPYKKTGPYCETLCTMPVGSSVWIPGKISKSGGLARTVKNRGFFHHYTARSEKDADGNEGFRMWREW